MKSIRTLVILFTLFLFFQLSMNFFIESLPNTIPNYDAHPEREFVAFVTFKVNGDLTFSGNVDQSQSLTDRLLDEISKKDRFEGNLISDFVAGLRIAFGSISFLIEFLVTILFTPHIIVQILLYDVTIGLAYSVALAVVVDIVFYSFLFQIIYKTIFGTK